jgi:hypothetical protein
MGECEWWRVEREYAGDVLVFGASFLPLFFDWPVWVCFEPRMDANLREGEWVVWCGVERLRVVVVVGLFRWYAGGWMGFGDDCILGLWSWLRAGDLADQSAIR